MQQEHTSKNNTDYAPTSQKIKVLLYHRVVHGETISRKCPWMRVHVRESCNQLELIDRWGVNAITFGDIRPRFKEQSELLPKPIVLTFDDGHLDMYKNAFPILQEYGMRAVIFAFGDTRIRASVWCRSLGLSVALLMEGQHLVELHAAGFEIGSHPMTHAKFTTLPEGEACEETSHSRILLEIVLNSPVLSFSYPYGLSNVTIRRIVANAGYNIACN